MSRGTDSESRRCDCFPSSLPLNPETSKKTSPCPVYCLQVAAVAAGNPAALGAKFFLWWVSASALCPALKNLFKSGGEFRGSRVPRNFGGSRPSAEAGVRGTSAEAGVRGWRPAEEIPQISGAHGPPPGDLWKQIFSTDLPGHSREAADVPRGYICCLPAVARKICAKKFFSTDLPGGGRGHRRSVGFPLRVSIRGPLLPRKFRGPLLPRKFRGPLLPRKFRGSLLPPKFRGSLLPRKFRGVLLARHRADCKPLRIRGRDEDTDRCRCGGSGGWILLFDKGNTDRDLLQL